MINKNKLHGLIIAKGYTQYAFANKIGMSKNAFSDKINNKAYFNTKEIEKICNELNITNCEDKIDIFLHESS